MVPNIKYYVVTITSIFLALGVGIFMGFMLDADGLVASQREDIVAELEKTFEEMRLDTEEVRSEIARVEENNHMLNSFIEDLLAILTGEKLSGYSLAMIEVNEDYIYTDTSEFLLASGAELASKTVIKNTLFENEEGVKEIYAEVIGEDFEGDLGTLIADEISRSIEERSETPLVRALLSGGYLELTGSYENVVDTLILAGGSSHQGNTSRDLSGKLINKLKTQDLRVIGVERSDVEDSYIEQYREERVSSVDNVDTSIGRVTLLALIRGENGNFGESDGSTQLRPNLDSLLDEE